MCFGSESSDCRGKRTGGKTRVGKTKTLNPQEELCPPPCRQSVLSIPLGVHTPALQVALFF